MRLWSIHPKHLDAKGLVALWREGLLARAVLLGRTKGYRHHPQLKRFRLRSDPIEAIDAYLYQVLLEARSRGYNFDGRKIKHVRGLRRSANRQRPRHSPKLSTARAERGKLPLPMSTAQDISEVMAALDDDQRALVIDFARLLRARDALDSALTFSSLPSSIDSRASRA